MCIGSKQMQTTQPKMTQLRPTVQLSTTDKVGNWEHLNWFSGTPLTYLQLILGQANSNYCTWVKEFKVKAS